MNEAVINFTESAEAELEAYQLRGVPGPEYSGEDEVVLATLPKGAPRVFRTGFSLTAPGTAASFKVYVVLTTGNEAGSEPVTVERPQLRERGRPAHQDAEGDARARCPHSLMGVPPTPR